MNHQDWNNITLAKTFTNDERIKRGEKTIEPRQTNHGNKTVANDTPNRKLDTDELLPILRSDAVTGRTIIDARVTKKWNQTELARHANVAVSVVRTLENGTAIINTSAELTKISKALGMNTIKKPKSTKNLS